MPKTLMFTLLICGLILFLVPATVSADGTQVVEIYAGQHTLVGNLVIQEGGGNLTVTYQITTPGWCFTVTHLYVGSEPPEKSAPGQFPYKHENLPCVLTDTYTVPGDSSSYVAAHSEVSFSASNAAPLQIPSGTVNYHIASATFGSPSYFDPTTTTAGVLNGPFKGWCVDTGNSINAKTEYSANVFSSYDPNLPAGLVDHPENLDLLNYILNQNYLGQGMTYGDIQRAIWQIIDDTQSTAGLGLWDEGNVNKILTDALANGEGFVPVCGQIMAVILDPLLPGVQHTIIEYPVPCVAPGPDRDETAWALASNITLFGQGWGGYFTLTLNQTSSSNDASSGPIIAGPPGNSGNAPPPQANNNENAGPPSWSSTEPVTEADSITPITQLDHCRVETNYMLNLREGPGLEYEVLRQVPFETQMDAIARQGDWFNVSYWNGYETVYGWLLGSNNYLKLMGNCR